MPKLRFGFFHVGRECCAAAWTAKGLAALVLPRPSRKQALKGLRGYLPPLPEETWNQPAAPVPSAVQKQTRLALAGKPFDFRRFDLSFLTPFQQRVLRSTTEIPWGQVRTYGWVAQKSGSPCGFRATGQALNRNPIPIFIPCHRVIASGNFLGGYGSGLEWKIRLLACEGIAVKNQQITVDLKFSPT